MKITNGEIRGTIVLVGILLLILAAVWWFGRTADTSTLPEGSVNYFREDSALIMQRSANYEKSRHDRRLRSDSTHRSHHKSEGHSRRKSKAKPKKAPAPDRPSPLDSPVQ